MTPSPRPVNIGLKSWNLTKTKTLDSRFIQNLDGQVGGGLSMLVMGEGDLALACAKACQLAPPWEIEALPSLLRRFQPFQVFLWFARKNATALGYLFVRRGIDQNLAD